MSHPDPTWRCGTHKNPYNACWACMLEGREKDKKEAATRAVNRAIAACKSVTTGNSAVRKTVVEQCIEAIERECERKS